MEELFAALLEVIVEGDLIADTALIISEDILSEVAFSTTMIEDVYTGIVETLSVFKDWMVATFKLSSEVVNAMLGLQLIYNMVYTHYQMVYNNSQCISVEVALQDIEGTLKKNFKKMQQLAQKQIDSPTFSKLPVDIQVKIRKIQAQTPMAYWLASKLEIMHSLMKIPIYSN